MPLALKMIEKSLLTKTEWLCSKLPQSCFFSCICVASYAKLLQIITSTLSLGRIYRWVETKNWCRRKINIRKIVGSVVNSIVKSSASA